MHVLVLCTGNSARSIVAEMMIDRRGNGTMTSASAGSRPVGTVNPTALEMLADKGYATDGLWSKGPDAHLDGSDIDVVITVCDRAAGDPCPIWPGAPITVHWALPDPAHIIPDDACRRAFEQVYEALEPAVDKLIAAANEGQTGKDLEAVLKAAAPDLKGFS